MCNGPSESDSQSDARQSENRNRYHSGNEGVHALAVNSLGLGGSPEIKIERRKERNGVGAHWFSLFAAADDRFWDVAGTTSAQTGFVNGNNYDAELSSAKREARLDIADNKRVSELHATSLFSGVVKVYFLCLFCHLGTASRRGIGRC